MMLSYYSSLNPEKALIWRIIHRDNLPWILDNGLHCKNSQDQDPNYVAIGNADLIERRSHRLVPVAPGGVLSDYVPFYFTPFSPMMYNICTGRGGVVRQHNEDIYILVSVLDKVHQLGSLFAFTDRHAYLPLAKYFNSLDNLNEIDWPLLQARNFKRNPDDPEQIERYQAEALVYRHLPVDGLVGIICYTETLKQRIEQEVQIRNLTLPVYARKEWYF